MTEREFYLPSSDGQSQIRCMEWIPDGEVSIVLQIVHGMTEHIGKYREFAVWLAEQGIAVIGHDHLGHGKTVKNKDDFGYFGVRGGAVCLVKDIRRVGVCAKKKYPHVSYILMGHSMGSFLVRRYLSVYEDGPDGIILMGTGAPAEPLVRTGHFLASMMARIKGPTFRSKLLYEMSLGNYNRKFKPVTSSYDWLSRDTSYAECFGHDPYCQFIFTVSAYRDFFHVILAAAKDEKKRHVRTDMPMLLVSGDKDPVGDDGKGVSRVRDRYSRAGVKKLTMILYEEMRHEILHEIGSQKVFEDICKWMQTVSEK